MTSITSNVTSIPQASPSTNSSAPSSSSHARTPSVSGQTSSSAAVQASAPAQRQLSYATAASKKPTPVIAASPSSPHVPVGASAQNARPTSTASPAVNGKIPPTVANSGPAAANGTPNPFPGGHHSRKSSVASGAGGSMMPNGPPRGTPAITFGTLHEATGPASSGSAAAASNPSLTAPLASNQKASSPQSSPSPVVRPMATGGVPPGQATAASGRIQFGEATHHHQRPMSMPPVPSGPVSMQSHQRRESTQSNHTETGPSHLGQSQRSGMRNPVRGGHQNYGPSHHQNYQQSHQYNNNGYNGRGGYGGPNQNRGQPPNMGQQPYGGPAVQGYPNSPRNIHRSPAMSHASPSLATVQPMVTPQLYPPQQQQYMPPQAYGGLQASMHYDPNQYQAQGYYQQAYLGYPQMTGQMGAPYPMSQTSPRAPYQQMAPPVSGYNLYQTQPMSRQGSTNMPHMEVPGRPTSGIGQMPAPTHTPQSISVPPNNPPTPGPGVPGSPFQKPKPSKAIKIVNPTTGAKVNIEKSQASPVVVTSAPVIVSSPSPAPVRSVSRNALHSRSASASAKTEQEKKEELKKREEMKAAVAKSLEEDRKKEEEAREKERLEAEKKEAEKKEAEERLRKEREEEERRIKEEEDRKLKEEEERKIREAEEKARKEAEEEAARKAEEERIRKEAEEAEAEAARVAAEKAAEEARIAKEKEEEEARIEAEKARKLKEEEEAKAKAQAEAEAEAKAAEEAAQKALASPPSTPAIAKPTTPDSESMPPPTLRGAEKSRSKPSPLNLQIKTNEPGPPSAALTALKSARFIDNINSVNYPANILSPNPALNPAASGKFKYEKDFLLQFQTVFTEKPTVDWDKTMRDTVGEPDSARPQTARTPGLGPRGSSRSGASVPQPMGTFGSFKPSLPANMLTSEQRFQQSRPTSLPVNPLASMVSGFPQRSGGVGIMRTNSSSSLANNGLPQSPRMGGDRRSQRGSSRKGGVPMEKTESRQGDKNNQPTIPISDVKPLPVSENRWKPRVGLAKGPETAPTPSEEVRLSPELVQRKVKAALNKMTPEKFDKISDQILDITSQSKFETDGRTLRQVIQLTFEKATDEAAWSSMYAKFCKRMLESMDPNIKDEGIRDKNDQVVMGGNLFRKYLLNRCQEEFERGWKINLPPKPEGVSDEAVMLSDEYYIAAAAKRRGLGLVQFIGELFKLGMLTERIMNECIRKLLDFEGIAEDETVESLCKLLKTIGLQLDTSEKSKGMMDMYFHRIGQLSENKDLNSRMRFMLMDIIDLRRKKWETKEADKGPKTIQEVREDALKAQQEKEAASRANQRRPGGGGGRGGDNRSFSQGFGGQMHPPNWQDQSKGGTLNADDLRKLTNKSRQASSSATQGFGPGGLLGSRSSSNGSRRGFGPAGTPGRMDDSNPSSRTSTPIGKGSTSHANPFSLLQESTSAHHETGEQNDTTSPPASSPPTAASLPVGDLK